MSRTNEDNLKALAAELLNFNKLQNEFKVHTEKGLEFDMAHYFHNPPDEPFCSACAVGVAYYVLKREAPSNKFLGFTSMAEQQLTPPDFDAEEWFDWVFASNWHDADNTPEGAAFRILYGLKYGIPLDREDFEDLEKESVQDRYYDIQGAYWNIVEEFINEYQ